MTLAPNARTRPRHADPRALLALLVLLVCVLGGKAPEGPGPSGGGQRSDPGSVAITCPADDGSGAPFPGALPLVETAAVGATPGSFAVSRSGEATYAIPLSVVPGRAGMEPSLAITYSSAGGEGLLGVGFALSGLSAITRCPATLAQDQHIRAVRYDELDHFCLDGARLVQVAAAFDFDGSGTREYRTFPDSFAKVVAHYGPGAGHPHGPERFEVRGRDTHVRDYGATEDARAMAKGGVIAAWWMSRERDRRDNEVTYSYTNARDPADGHTVEIIPERIAYAHREDHAAARSVRFVTTAAPVAQSYFSGGMRLRRSRSLARVDMMMHPGNVVVRSYQLAYEPGEGTGRALLRSVTECAGDAGPCKPATRFAWSSHASEGLVKHVTQEMIADHDPGRNGRTHWLLADVNGDGLGDLVISRPGASDETVDEWWVALNHGGDFDAPTRWIAFAHPDNPDSLSSAVAVDVNQDGLADIFLDTPNGNWATYRVLLARADHTFAMHDTGIPRPPQISYDDDHTYSDKATKIGSHEFTRLGDIDGDGVADLIRCVNSKLEDEDDTQDDLDPHARWTVNLWSPDGGGPGIPGFSPAPIAIGPLDGLYCWVGLHWTHVVDVDGDGTAELVVPSTQGSQDYVAYKYTGQTWTSQPLDLPSRLRSPFAQLHWLDTNADGLADVIMTGYAQGCGGPLGEVKKDECDAAHFQAPSEAFTADIPIGFHNTGPRFIPAGFTLPGALVDVEDSEWTDLYGDAATAFDDNGDGRMDLLMPVQGRCGDGTRDPCWVVLRASLTGEGPMVPVDTGIRAIHDGTSLRPSYVARVDDVDGDGRQDIVLPDGENFTHFAVYRSDGPQDLLVSITDGTSPLDPGEPGFIPTVAIHYGSLVDLAVTKSIPAATLQHDNLVYVARSDPENGCAYPRVCVAGPGRVVDRYFVANGQNQPRSFRVKYRDGRYHRRRRGFLGFGERLVLDASTGAGSAEFYDNVTNDPAWDAYPYAGQVVRAWAWSTEKASATDPGRVEMTFTQRELLQEDTSAGQTWFTMQTAVTTTRQEGQMTPGPGKSVLRFVAAAEKKPHLVLGRSTDRAVVHDEYGNVLVETHDVDGADLASSVTRTYDNDPATWLIGLLRHERVCSSALGMTQCRVTDLDRNGHGEVISGSVGDPADAATQRSFAVAHDKYGHVTHTTAHDASGHYREGCVSYDAEGMFPFATRNALGHTTYSKQEARFGAPVASIDENGLATRWQHDQFGRVVVEERADGTTSRVTLTRTKDGGPQGTWWNVKVTTREDGGAIRTTEYDSAGRPVRALTVAAAVEACGATVCSSALQLEEDTEYDYLGRMVSTSLPWMTGDARTGKLRHQYAYDASGRMTKHVEPWGRSTTFAHAGLVDVATDWLGSSSMVSDVLGRPVMVFDRDDRATETEYGPFGAVWLVTRFGSEVNVMERDAYGRVIHEEDPDRGATELSYDGFGEVLTVDDAAGRHHDFAYDALGRMVGRADVDGQTSWTYDTAAQGVGKLAEVENLGSRKRYTYDALSRLESVALTLGAETFQATFGYDGQSRLRSVAYPQAPGVAPLVIRREYDGYGNLTAVRDNAGGKPYWQLTGLDGAGRPVAETFGNGVTARREFDPGSGLVKRMQVNAGPWTKIQDLTYSHDTGLRMTSRADNLQVGPSGVRTETFTHDVLGRLTCSRLADIPAGQAGATRAGPCALAIGYAENGNITSKSDVGAYTYDPAHPHAMATAGASSFGYDDVGNQNERPGASITYTAFDLPKLMVEPDTGTPVAEFTYDGDQQRIRKLTPQEDTVYFEDLYERATVTGGAAMHRYYVAAGSATLVLTRTADQGSGSTAYLHSEALGSTDVVTDAGGGVVQRRSYDAFGARRHPQWGQPAAGGFVSKASRVGFTGHEDEDDLGLVNMRGRIYDPRVGRFLQTDPIVAAPHVGQSWNPYSYVTNSPLNFTDPSGFDGVGRYDNRGGVSGQFPVAGVTGQGPSLEQRLGGAIDRARADAEWNAGWGKKDAARDDAASPAGAPQAVREGSPFAAGSMKAAGSSKSEAVAAGVAAGVLGHLRDLFAPNPREYLKALSGTALVDNAVSGARQDGVMGGVAGAINTVNPLYQAGMAAVDVDRKADAGDLEGAVHDGTRLVLNLATAVVAGAVGGEGVPQGGSYRGVRTVQRGGEVHHMPSWNAQEMAGNSPFTRRSAPGIMMDVADHMQTASWGSKPTALRYRTWQADMLKQGRFLEVLARDIEDVERIAPGKYSGNIQQMLDHLWSGQW